MLGRGATANIAIRNRMNVSAPVRSEGTMLHIDIPTLAEFKALAQVKGETCVSLYLPTSPLGENAKLNRTAFKDIAKEALSQLKEAGADKKKIAVFEGQFEHLAGQNMTFRTKTRSESCSAQSRTRSSRSGTIRETGWRCLPQWAKCECSAFLTGQNRWPRWRIDFI